MSSRILYATAQTIQIWLMDFTDTRNYLTVDPTVVHAEIQLSKDGAAPVTRSATGTIAFLAHGLLNISLSATDTTCKDLVVSVIDAGSKVYEDNSRYFHTVEHASAKFNDAKEATLLATQTTVGDTNTKISVPGDYKADVSALALQSTLTATQSTVIDTNNKISIPANYMADVSSLALQSTLLTTQTSVTTIDTKIGTPTDLGSGANLSDNNVDIFAEAGGAGGLTATQADQLLKVSQFCYGDFDIDDTTPGTSIVQYTNTVEGGGTPGDEFTLTLTDVGGSIQERRVSYPA